MDEYRYNSVLFAVTCNRYLFNMSDYVCVALLVTTTANVLGLAFIVLDGISSQQNKKAEQQKLSNETGITLVIDAIKIE